MTVCQRMMGLALSGAALALGSAVRAEHPWLRAETPDARIISDCSKGDVVEFAVRYAAFRHAFNQLVVPDGRRAPPSTILLFRRKSTFREYTPPSDNLIAYTTSIDSSALLALTLDGDLDLALQNTLTFDTMWLLPRVGYILPLWMAQGTGEVFSTLRVRKGECVLGEIPDGYESIFNRETPVKWARFFDIANGSREYTGSAVNPCYFVQAWGLMDRVFFAPGDARERFRQLAGTVNFTSADQDSLAGVLGTDPQELDRVVRSQVFGESTRRMAFDEAALRSRITVAEAPEAELDVYLADLLAASGKALEAEVRLDRARVLAPHAAYVDEGLARNDIRNGRSDLAVEDYRAALAAGSTNPRAYIVSAQARLDDSQSGGLDYAGEGGFGIATAIQEIRRALVLDPGNTDAYVLLGRAFYVAPTVTEKDIAELKPGLNAGSDGPKVRFYRALLYHRLNQLDRSVAELGAVATDSRAEPSLQAAAISQARREIFDRDRKKVEQAVRAGNFEAAEALLRAALAHPDLATDVDAYRRLKASVDEAQQMSGLIELYNKQRWSELAQAADAFAAAYPKSQNLYQVKAMKKRAARMLQR